MGPEGYSRHSILFSLPVFNGRLFFHTPLRGDTIVFKLPSSGHVDYISGWSACPATEPNEGRAINDKILKLHQDREITNIWAMTRRCNGIRRPIQRVAPI